MLGDGLDKPISSQITWIDASHNPEVAGSNPAPATAKALETGPFCYLPRGRAAKLLPNFCPDQRHGWQWVRFGSAWLFSFGRLNIQRGLRRREPPFLSRRSVCEAARDCSAHKRTGRAQGWAHGSDIRQLKMLVGLSCSSTRPRDRRAHAKPRRPRDPSRSSGLNGRSRRTGHAAARPPLELVDDDRSAFPSRGDCGRRRASGLVRSGSNGTRTRGLPLSFAYAMARGVERRKVATGGRHSPKRPPRILIAAPEVALLPSDLRELLNGATARTSRLPTWRCHELGVGSGRQ
jgi:hypothetical protein